MDFEMEKSFDESQLKKLAKNTPLVKESEIIVEVSAIACSITVSILLSPTSALSVTVTAGD
ncbi:hypothetical protein [Dolosigranulum pigrum]|uniref:hypothetical protein n=1 Tax=Dolosigranulum pigrum TaxID=29394 RepID=UPI001AD8887E|nr:hypothetical protein [Dolosigranulum pigrum]QTJ55623.1 hypothetical protein FE334_07765 [Dolosigranulum pigrum]